MIFETIKNLCEEKGMSIAQLEREAGLKNGTIGKWRTASPTIKNLKSVADVLKVKIEKLIK